MAGSCNVANGSTAEVPENGVLRNSDLARQETRAALIEMVRQAKQYATLVATFAATGKRLAGKTV
jgi:hypothetical protein